MIKKVKTLNKTLKNCLLDMIASREGAAKVIIASAYAEYKNNVTLGLRLEASHVTIKKCQICFCFFVCISHQSFFFVCISYHLPESGFGSLWEDYSHSNSRFYELLKRESESLRIETKTT